VIESITCSACRNRYDNRTWYGAVGAYHEIDVSTFVMSRRDDIMITFEMARDENDAIKCYFKMEVTFGDTRQTTARFFISPITAELNLSDIVRKFVEIIDGFCESGVSEINHLRFYWDRDDKPPNAGTFINTLKFIASKRAIVNV